MDKMDGSTHIWEPLEAFYDNDRCDRALLILNQPIHKVNKFVQLWKSSQIHICVDGGTNRLHDWYIDQKIDEKFIPDLICGDLDSIKDEIREFYEQKGTKSIKLLDQDSTDFQKTLKLLVELISLSTESKYKNIRRVYTVCEFGGRIDHALSNLSSLYEPVILESGLQVFLVSSESIVFLLQPGTNIINLDPKYDIIGKYCGFFPLTKPALVTTQGLKWNVNDQQLEFGKFISSSNELLSKQVIIKTNEPLVWTMSF